MLQTRHDPIAKFIGYTSKNIKLRSATNPAFIANKMYQNTSRQTSSQQTTGTIHLELQSVQVQVIEKFGTQ